MSVGDQVKEIFREKLLIDPPDEETDLLGTGLLDSALFVELLFHLEEAFVLKFTLENLDIENFRSLSRIVHLVGASHEHQNLVQ